MRYKSLVLSKLESVENLINNLNSLLSNPTTTREQFDYFLEKTKERIDEVKTLINSETE